MIVGHGFTSAKVIFIGDGADDNDMASGRALSGHTEESFLRQGCHAHGLNFNECYRTLLIKERINLKNNEANRPLITDQYRNILKAEIQEISPNVIVPLSELSFEFVSGLTGIRKFRGSILPSLVSNRIMRCVPILGPNPYLNEDPKMFFISRLDFSKVAKSVNEVGPIPEEGLVWVAKNATQLREFLNRSWEASSFAVFDIETFCGIPTCISICLNGQESCTVPLLDRDIPLDDRILMATLVAQFLQSAKPKVNQNIKFDWKKLNRWGFKVNNVVGDTMLAAAILYPEFPKNLGFLTSIYTDMPYFKDEGKEYDPSKHNRDRLYLYCAKDSLATHRIYSRQLEELEETGTKPVYDKVMEVFPIYKQMEENGIRIDGSERQRLLIKYTTLHDIQILKLARLCNTQISNLVGKKGTLSHQKIRKIVYEDLGYKKIAGVKTTQGGEPGTDEESLEILMWMSPMGRSFDSTAILMTIITVRKIHKVIEYLHTPIHPDNRMRCEFNLGGAGTGRTTAGETTDSALVFDERKIKHVNLGRSFQTIAKHGFELDGAVLGKELRGMFVPSRGYAFVENDLSQAEARVDAILAKDFEILKIFDTPTGIHRLTGSWVFDCKPEEIKKGILVDGVDRYHLAKTARHAGERNMKDMRLMMMIHRPLKECGEILRKFHKAQPNIKEVFHREIREFIQKHRYLRAPNGRKRDFFGRWGEDMINQGISQLPQAIVTDYLKAGLRRTMDECPYARPLSEAHDGFLSEVPIGKEEEYGSTFSKNTMVPIDFRTCSLPRDFELIIPCECEFSRENWKEMKELKFG